MGDSRNKGEKKLAKAELVEVNQENYNTIESRKWTKKYKFLAFSKISNGKIICARCGLDKIDYLQINHKDGNGKSDHQSIRSFYRKIALGRRDTKDLEILCSLCNWAYFLENKLKVKYSIKLINNKRRKNE